MSGTACSAPTTWPTRSGEATDPERWTLRGRVRPSPGTPSIPDDASGPVLRLRVRYRGDGEISGWQDGPELAVALGEAEAKGWQSFDREPGGRPGEYAIFHRKRATRR